MTYFIPPAEGTSRPNNRFVRDFLTEVRSGDNTTYIVAEDDTRAEFIAMIVDCHTWVYVQAEAELVSRLTGVNVIFSKGTEHLALLTDGTTYLVV